MNKTFIIERKSCGCLIKYWLFGQEVQEANSSCPIHGLSEFREELRKKAYKYSRSAIND